MGGNVLMSNNYGVVDISAAEIKLGLSFVGANIKVDAGNTSPNRVIAIVAEHIKVGKAMLWRQMSGNGIVDLASSSVGTLSDEINAWDDFTVILEEFSYGNFVDADMTPDSRRYWLSKQVEFSAQPYDQLAKILFKAGRPLDAWDILRTKRQLERKHKKVSWLRHVSGEMIDIMQNLVFRPLRIVAWTLLFVFVGAAIFGIAEDYDQNRSASICPF